MIEVSKKRNIVSQWLVWHYLDSPKAILKAFKNFLVFNFNFFSIGLLAKTLFSHWRRYREFYPRGFDIKRYFQVWIGNMISRCLGAFVRIVTIMVGLIVEILILIAGVIVFLAWIFLPVFLIFGFYFGLKLLI
jgi:hypothetical protein